MVGEIGRRNVKRGGKAEWAAEEMERHRVRKERWVVRRRRYETEKVSGGLPKIFVVKHSILNSEPHAIVGNPGIFLLIFNHVFFPRSDGGRDIVGV